jgi:hypothetical protein
MYVAHKGEDIWLRISYVVQKNLAKLKGCMYMQMISAYIYIYIYICVFTSVHKDILIQYSQEGEHFCVDSMQTYTDMIETGQTARLHGVKAPGFSACVCLPVFVNMVHMYTYILHIRMYIYIYIYACILQLLVKNRAYLESVGRRKIVTSNALQVCTWARLGYCACMCMYACMYVHVCMHVCACI